MASVAVVSRIIAKRKVQRAENLEREKRLGIDSNSSCKSGETLDKRSWSVFKKRASIQWDHLDLIRLLARGSDKNITQILSDSGLETKKKVKIGYAVIFLGFSCLVMGLFCFVVHFKRNAVFEVGEEEQEETFYQKIVFAAGPIVTAAGVMLAICGYVSIQVAEDKQKRHMRDLLKSYSE